MRKSEDINEHARSSYSYRSRWEVAGPWRSGVGYKRCKTSETVAKYTPDSLQTLDVEAIDIKTAREKRIGRTEEIPNLVA